MNELRQLLNPEPVYPRFAAGWNHILLLTRAGQLYGQGSTGAGQLGPLGPGYCAKFQRIETPGPVRAMAAGDYYSIIVLVDGRVYGCGFNGHVLGLDDNQQRNTFTLIETPQPITAVATSLNIVLLLGQDGRLYAFGTSSGLIFGGDGATRPTLIEPMPPGQIVDFAVAPTHIVVLNDRGQVYGCGRAWAGQLGLKCPQLVVGLTQLDVPEAIASVHLNESATLLRTTAGRVYAAGDNSYGQLGLADPTVLTFTVVPFPQAIRSLVTGMYYTVAVTDNDDIYAFGNVPLGLLPIAQYRQPRPPTLITTPGPIAVIAAGRDRLFILTETGLLYCYSNLDPNTAVAMTEQSPPAFTLMDLPE